MIVETEWKALWSWKTQDLGKIESYTMEDCREYPTNQSCLKSQILFVCYAIVQVDDPLIAEANATLLGVTKATKFQMSNIIFWGDALNVIQPIQYSIISPHGSIESIMFWPTLIPFLVMWKKLFPSPPFLIMFFML